MYRRARIPYSVPAWYPPHVISFVSGRCDAGDYVPDRSADIVCSTIQVLVSGSRKGELIVRDGTRLRYLAILNNEPERAPPAGTGEL